MLLLFILEEQKGLYMISRQEVSIDATFSIPPLPSKELDYEGNELYRLITSNESLGLIV